MFAGIDVGYVDIARTSEPRAVGTDRPVDRHVWFDMGFDRDDMYAHAAAHSGEDLYYAVSAYGQKFRKKDDELGSCRVVYADADGFPPTGFRIPPSISVESSSGNWHCYWMLDRVYSQVECARVSSKLPKAHGIDASSGIQTKLLRVPGSVNTKYGTPTPVVAYTDNDVKQYTLAELDAAYTDVVSPMDYGTVDVPTPGKWPDMFDVMDKVPAHERLSWLLAWDKRTADDPDKRSEHRWELIRRLMELTTLTPEEIAVLVWGAHVSDHYREQGRDIDHLWQFDVLPAMAKQGSMEVEPLQPVTPVGEISFLNEVELAAVMSEPGFMERWEAVNYKSLHPKTPNQYIRINGYTLLAGTLGNKVAVMPPGTTRAVYCNLYAINLGPTTSGKSEALFFLKRYLTAFSKKVGYDVVVGSNATAEGLIKALKGYDKRTAMLVTEETSSKFRQWLNSASMAHAREAELEIYDGYLPKNLRAGDGAGSTEDVHLSFTQYMMGVGSEVESLLDRGFLRSGYIPRCLVVRAERTPFDVNELLTIPQGDVNLSQDYDPEPALWAERFNNAITKNGRRERHGKVVMQFDGDAWTRFLTFRAGLLSLAETHDDPDVVRPMAIRFAISCQKMMALLAYERVAENVQMVDVLRVLHDAENLWVWAMELVQGVQDSAFARLQLEVVEWLQGRGSKARLSDYHNKFNGLQMRDRLEVLESLERRNVLVQSKSKTGIASIEVAA